MRSTAFLGTVINSLKCICPWGEKGESVSTPSSSRANQFGIEKKWVWRNLNSLFLVYYMFPLPTEMSGPWVPWTRGELWIMLSCKEPPSFLQKSSCTKDLISLPQLHVPLGARMVLGFGVVMAKPQPLQGPSGCCPSQVMSCSEHHHEPVCAQEGPAQKHLSSLGLHWTCTAQEQFVLSEKQQLSVRRMQGLLCHWRLLSWWVSWSRL